MKKKLNDLKGYYYVVEKDKIREYMNIPPRSRLEWLEEANDFIWKATDSKTRKIREKFRRGEV